MRCFAVADDIGHLAFAVAVVDRHHDGAQNADRKPRQRHGRDIGQHHRDMRALADAQTGKSRRNSMNARLKLGIGDFFIGFDEMPYQLAATVARRLMNELSHIRGQRLGFDFGAALRCRQDVGTDNFGALRHACHHDAYQTTFQSVYLSAQS